jgi:hypothetical protein
VCIAFFGPLPDLFPAGCMEDAIVLSIQIIVLEVECTPFFEIMIFIGIYV